MLIDILNELSAQYGYNLANAEEKSLAISRVNYAAKELHTLTDIEEASDEIVVDINQNTQQVALPEGIGRIRGVRYYISRAKVEIDHRRNRSNQKSIR
jgi:hypothetical protein